MQGPSVGWEDRVRDSFARQQMMATTLGATIASLEPGRITLRMDRKPEVTQQHGFVHAGATASLADSACGYAAYSLARPGYTVLTVEYKLNLMAPADGDVLVAEGRVIRSGRTLSVCTAKVTVSHGGGEPRPVALMQGTIMLLEGSDH